MFGLGLVGPFGFCNGKVGFPGCDLSGLFLRTMVAAY